MQKIILVLTTVLFSVAGFSQNDESLVITPGVGIGKLKLGMSEDQAIKILQGEVTWSGYQEQLKSFASDGTRIDSVLQFVAGFDSCARYNGDLPESMPVFSMFFKNHKLNFITVSSYSATEEHLQQVAINNGLKLHAVMADCVQKLGKDYSPIGYGDYTGDYYYYKIGLETVFDDGKLTAIGIFPPMPDFKSLMAKKSGELKKQAAAAKEEN
jgi:hypothetical protein